MFKYSNLIFKCQKIAFLVVQFFCFLNSSHNVSNTNATDKQNSPNRVNTTPTLNNVNNTSPGNPVGVVKGVQQAKSPEPNSPPLKDVPPYR